MKKISGILALLALSALLITSCDIIEEPFLVPVAGSNDTIPVVEKVRKVLLEDFTGQKCPNCPEAAEIAHNLKTIYGEQLILLTVHAFLTRTYFLPFFYFSSRSDCSYRRGNRDSSGG